MRLAWPVVAIELFVIRRITLLTRRAAAASTDGRDEQGVLVQGLNIGIDAVDYTPPIAAAMLERIFEYGVSDAHDAPDSAAQGQRGQGLFVARTYMAKMGGTVTARNTDGGVAFILTLQRPAG